MTSSKRRLGTMNLALHHLRSSPGTSVLVAVLVGITVLVVSLAPRALAQLSTDELRYSLSELSPLKRDISATGVFGFPTTVGHEPATAAEVFDHTDEVLRGVTERLDAPLSSTVGDAHWIVRTAGRSADRIGSEPAAVHPVLSLAIDLDWIDRVQLVEGELPVPWTGNEADGADPLARAPIEIALSEETAENAGFVVGDLLDYRPAPLKVAAIYRPVDPEDDYWLHALDLKEGEPFSSTNGTTLYAAAFVDPGSGVGMRDTLGSAKLAVWYPVDGDALQFGEAETVRDQARQLMAVGRLLPSGEAIAFTTGLADAVDGVLKRMNLVISLLALAVSGPIGVVLAVFALGVRSVIDRRRSALSLISARGASGLQARTLMIIEGLLIAVPAGAIGIFAAAALIPTPAGAEAFVLPVILTLIPPVLFAVSTSPGSFSGARSDIRVRARTGVRWVLEVAAIGIAALSLTLLFRRGLAETSGAVGVDPLLVATPLLLSVAVCIVVLRVYPALMIGVERWTRSLRGAVAVVGAARAVRAPALGFAASLALVVGISIAVFSSVLSTTVVEALETNARLTAGADVRVNAPVLDASTADELAELPGVAALAAFQRASNVSLEAGGHETSITVVFADLASLHHVRPDLPVPAFNESSSTDGPTRFYLSASLAHVTRVGQGDPTTLATVRGEVAGVLADAAMPTVPDSWVLVDASAAESLGTGFAPHELLVDIADGASVESVVSSIRSLVEAAQSESERGSVHLIASDELLATAEAEPVISGLQSALLLAALIAVLLSVLAVVLASASAGAVRNRLIAVLRILGMSSRQLSGLMAWELAPVAVTAIVAGTALGLAELWIVLAALDLRPFLGGEVPPVPAADAAQVAGVVAGFVLVVVIAGAVTTAIGRRLSPASNIKMGAE